MPILGRTPDECFAPFRDHMAGLLAATLSATEVLNYVGHGARRTLAFLRGEGTTVPIRTNDGALYFYLSQTLEAVKEGRKNYRLRTLQYWYRLQLAPGLNEQALLRWEYDSSLSADTPTHCRHHVQAATNLAIGRELLDLNHAHVPTGWVTIEEVLRFLIVDLEVKPLCGEGWPAKLTESEQAFYEKFTSKRYKK